MKKITYIVLMVLIGLPAVSVCAASVTLQQGSGGYTGCADSYMYTVQPDQNFDENNMLQLYEDEVAG